MRKTLASLILPNPTPQNSWSGQKDNAAWILVSVTGSPPRPSVRSLVLSCLTSGSPPAGTPTSPGRYDRDAVVLCIEAKGRASVLSAKDIAAISSRVAGHTIPPRFVPYLIFAYTATSADARDGLALLILLGKTSADALSLRAQLNTTLNGAMLSHSPWSGTRKNVAWFSFRIRTTTAAGIASSKRTLLDCLP